MDVGSASKIVFDNGVNNNIHCNSVNMKLEFPAMSQITVDLSDDKATLLKAAEFILLFAGYAPPKQEAPKATVADRIDHLIERGKEITREDMAREATVIVREADLVKLPPDPVTVFGADAGSPYPRDKSDPQGLKPPAPPPAGIDVDSRGMPWDARIHAATRAKIADGSWRQKRNVDKNLLEVVEAELRATMGAPVPPAPPAPPAPVVPPIPAVAPPAPDATDGWPAAPVVPPVPFAGNAVPPVPPVTGTPPVPASAGAATTASPGSGAPQGPVPTFPQLMGAITKGFTGGTITKPMIDAAISKVGLPALPMLASRPDLVAAVAGELGIAL